MNDNLRDIEYIWSWWCFALTRATDGEPGLWFVIRLRG